MDAVDNHRAGISAQEAARAARDVADTACDRKGMAFIQAVKYREGGEAVLSELRQSWGGEAPNLFGAHLGDMIVLLGRAAPNALKAAKPGSAEFRGALRDELERGKDVYLNNGLSNMSASDHNGYDRRSAFLIKVEGGAYRLHK